MSTQSLPHEEGPQVSQSTFPGFRFHVPWAPRLSDPSQGAADDLPASDSTGFMKTKTDSVSSRPDGSHVHLPARTDVRFSAISMPPQCFSFINRRRSNIRKRSSRPVEYSISKFQSLVSTSSTSS